MNRKYRFHNSLFIRNFALQLLKIYGLMSKQEEFYSKLKESLESQHKFPSKYLFKFIVPTANNQLDEVKEIFNLPGVVLNTKLSKTQKYVSASISMVASSADQIIAKYKEASKIDGIISL